MKQELLKQFLPLGAPQLRAVATRVGRVDAPSFRAQAERLRATLCAFRSEFGFGRAVAAPQVGIDGRFIALDLPNAPSLIVDPEIVWRSEDAFTMWDDCMSFPDLLVRVARWRSISVVFTDEQGVRREWRELDVAAAELLQHEIDHLDGVLALDRAVDSNSIISRAAYEADRAYFRAKVDYGIGE